MKRARESEKSINVQDTPAVRASISFPPTLYENLEKLAKQKKVSLAWIVRDAAEMYIADSAANERHAHADTRRSR